MFWSGVAICNLSSFALYVHNRCYLETSEFFYTEGMERERKEGLGEGERERERGNEGGVGEKRKRGWEQGECFVVYFMLTTFNFQVLINCGLQEDYTKDHSETATMTYMYIHGYGKNCINVGSIIWVLCRAQKIQLYMYSYGYSLLHGFHSFYLRGACVCVQEDTLQFHIPSLRKFLEAFAIINHKNWGRMSSFLMLESPLIRVSWNLLGHTFTISPLRYLVSS